jgi:YhcH/YjgK/YiaL family protein
MILDLLANSGPYRVLHPGFAAGFDWLARFTPETPDGRHDIVGDSVFALVQSYTTAPFAERILESHRAHIDIQFVALGSEVMAWADAGRMRARGPFDTARDVVFYDDPPTLTSLVCEPGMFTLFFPSDAHKGGCSVHGPTAVKKAVIKVRVS